MWFVKIWVSNQWRPGKQNCGGGGGGERPIGEAELVGQRWWCLLALDELLCWRRRGGEIEGRKRLLMR